MSSYSIRLAAVGTVIGVLTLTAAAYANRAAPPSAETTVLAAAAEPGTAHETKTAGAEGTAEFLTAQTADAETGIACSDPAETGDGEAADAETGTACSDPAETGDGEAADAETGTACSDPAETGDGEAAEAFVQNAWYAALRVETPTAGRIFVCDLRGSPLCAAVPDAEGDAALGPLPPGRYALYAENERLGSFRLTEDAALDEAAGRLWTDGEMLHLEAFRPGQAELSLTLPASGYYSLALVDDDGRRWTKDVFIPSDARPEQAGSYLRTLDFFGLPEGRYTLVWNRRPILQFPVLAGGVAQIPVALGS